MGVDARARHRRPRKNKDANDRPHPRNALPSPPSLQNLQLFLGVKATSPFATSRFPVAELCGGFWNFRWVRESHREREREEREDTEAKRKKLTGAKQRALKLKGEIRFLRKRYKLLTQTASPTPYRPKSHPNQSSNSIKHKQKAVNPVYRHDRSQTAGESTLPKATPILDLNQASLPEGDEEAEFNIASEARAKESSRKYLTEEDPTLIRCPKFPIVVSSSGVGSGLLKTPICRDAGSSSGQRGKRKVSWQDQVALKV
ncbi:ribosomal RNA small subunit methyltransferase G isoform X2 [Wolffia australiana]